MLQWHITERCNLHCTHCYQGDEAEPGLPPADLLTILDQFDELLAGMRRGGPVSGQVTVTGGEPFVRDDCMALLREIRSRGHGLALLTNGSLLDTPLVERLAALEPRYVQLSMDGGPRTHDKIRGPGNHAVTVAAARRLVRAGIRTLISFSAGPSNYTEFEQVARLGCELGVDRVWADRVIPLGSSSDEGSLGPHQTRALFEAMSRARDRARRRWFGRTEVAMHRALQFLISGSKPYRCSAGRSLLAVSPGGDLLPCRRLPVPVGNLMQTPMLELYRHAAVLRQLRQPRPASRGCEVCPHQAGCRGGLRCLAWATTGSPFTADPGCWLSQDHHDATTPLEATARGEPPACAGEQGGR